jgi:hypothetical protein
MSLAITPLALLSLPHRPGVLRIRLMRGPSGFITALARFGQSAQPERPGPVVIESVPGSSLGVPGTLFTVQQLLSGSPEWDLAPGPDGRPMLAITSFGGAINSVSVRSASGQAPLTPLKGSDDLHDPRFVRGPRAKQALTAVADGRQVLLFQPRAAGGYEPARVLLEGSKIENALLLDTAAGWVLLTRSRAMGLQHGTTSPGLLEARPLTADFRPAAPPFAVFGAQQVFDVDAVVTPSGFAVLAITAGGFALARVEKGQPVRVEQQKQSALAGPVSMLAEGATLHLAFLTEDGGVMLAKMPG